MLAGGHPVRFLLPVHLYGAPCAMEALCALLRKAGLAGEDETVKRIRIESGKLIIELVK